MNVKVSLRALALVAVLWSAAASAQELQVGDPAPDFRLIGSDGRVYQLSDFEGKQPVVIAFFPKAFTGG